MCVREVCVHHVLIFIIYQIELGNTFNVSSVRVCVRQVCVQNLLIFIIYQIELGNTFNVSSVRVCEGGVRVSKVCEGGVRAGPPHLHHLPDRAGEHLQCE